MRGKGWGGIARDLEGLQAVAFHPSPQCLPENAHFPLFKPLSAHPWASSLGLAWVLFATADLASPGDFDG